MCGGSGTHIARMSPDPDPLRLSGLAGPRSRTYRFGFAPTGLVGRIVGFLVGAVVLVLAFAFSLVLFAVLAVAAVIGGAWLWWKTRHVRRELRAAHARVRPGEREIRGEAVVVREDTAPHSGAAHDPSEPLRRD